ncbi:MAG TPA: type II secretion system protein GspN [Kofleriaceae bacterium]|jgi:type II secretion system protein N
MRFPRITRRMLRNIALYAIVGIVAFIFGFQATFPMLRVKKKAEEQFAAMGYDLTIADSDVHRGILPGSVSFDNVTLRTVPAKPDDVPSIIFINHLDAHVGLFAIAHGIVSIDFDAKIGPGSLSGNIRTGVFWGHHDLDIDIKGTKIPPGTIPLREGIGLPLAGDGKVEMALKMSLPGIAGKNGGNSYQWDKLDGALDLSCPHGCNIGDGKTKFKMKLKNARQQAVLGDGVEFGHIVLDSLVARIEAKNGKLEITKFETKSNDGEAHLDAVVTLTPALGDSLITGCIRYTVTESLRDREAMTWADITTLGAPRGPDGLFHIKLDGKLKDVKRLPLICGPDAPGVKQGMDNPAALGGARPRPTVTIQNEDEIRPPNGAGTAAAGAVGSAGSGGSAAQFRPGSFPDGEHPGEHPIGVPHGSGAAGSAGSAGSGSAGSGGSAETGSAETPPPPPPPEGQAPEPPVQ